MKVVALTEMEDHLLSQGWGGDWLNGQDAEAMVIVRNHVQQWLATGMPYTADENGHIKVDPVEVMNWMIQQGLNGADTFWRDRYVSSEQQLYVQIRGMSNGSIPKPIQCPSRRFRIRIERHYNVEKPAGVRMRLRLPVPFNGVGQTVHELLMDQEPPWQSELAPGRVEWGVPLGWHGMARLGLQATVECWPDASLSATLTEDERVRLTRMDEGFIENLPDIVNLSRQLQADNRDPLSFAQSAYKWTLRNLRFGSVDYGLLPERGALQEILRQGRADCQLWSAIFCAVCRASGVPARVISGYQLHKERPFHHYWAQAWIDGAGWRNWDSATWRLSAAGEFPEWEELFDGHMEPRLVLQVLPQTFFGTGSIRFPAHWHMLYRPAEHGIATSYVDSQTGQLIFEERCTLLP